MLFLPFQKIKIQSQEPIKDIDDNRRKNGLLLFVFATIRLIFEGNF